MNEKDLTYFRAVYETRNITHAAEKIFITPQGLSKAIKKIEAELEAPLFIRTQSALTPTSYADALYAKSQEIIDSLSSIKSDILLTGQHIKSNLTVVFTLGVLDYLGINFIYDFQKAYPDINLNIIQNCDTTVNEIMQKEKCEIGIIAGPVNTTLYDATFFTSHKHCVVINKANPLSSKKYISYQDLSTIPIALEGRQFCPYHNNMNRFLRNGITPNIALETTEIESTHRFASLNNGVGISVDFCALAHPYSNTVVRPFEDPECVWETYLITRKGAYLSDKAVTFKKFCLDWIHKNSAKLFHWKI